MQLAKIKSAKDNRKEELWINFDSGASRSVITESSPIRNHLHAITPAYGSCSIGDGTPLQYMEKGNVTDNLEITVVKDLKYDLFSSVSAAKQGLTSIIDFDLNSGQNNSYTIDKLTGAIIPLVERGILELPLHLMLPAGACFTVTPAKSHTKDELPPHVVSMFWHCYDDASFEPHTRANNKTEYSLFTFDIIKSLNGRERDFLIHAKLGHLPRKKILQMIKNGTTGIEDYSMQAKHVQRTTDASTNVTQKGAQANTCILTWPCCPLLILTGTNMSSLSSMRSPTKSSSHLKRKTADDVYSESENSTIYHCADRK
jgi:hypothetical protein